MDKVTTKESVLALFEEQRGAYFSGEEIAVRLAVSTGGSVESGKQPPKGGVRN